MISRIGTRVLAGTTLLAALVVVIDYSMKYSGLKIVFPWLPMLRFDFTGVPIALILYLFGIVPGIFASSVVFFAIVARSGDVVASLMKAVAELSTVVGMSIGLKLVLGSRKTMSVVLGVLARCFVMFLANLIVLPTYYRMPFTFVIGISPLIVAFNIVQGSVNILGAYIIYEALERRIPSDRLIRTEKGEELFSRAENADVIETKNVTAELQTMDLFYKLSKKKRTFSS